MSHTELLLTGTAFIQSGKRKRDEATSPEESRAKIRRTVRDHLVLDYARVLPTPSMTTVVCLHAAVAQKSYGNEKRFLCPPPVVRVEGPLRQPRAQQLAMRIVTETGERTNEQRATLDETMHASFKTLHVSGPAGFKAKNFQLVLDISDPESALGSTPWASFESSQVAIISKPSKKTAKTRNMSSCILAGGPVSLFNRINSQTVRTKYMAVEQGRLSASNSAWSAFNVTVVRSPAESEESPEQVPAQLSPTASSARAASTRSYSSSVGARPVTYGSEIILTDTLTGVASDPLIIRKVDKSRIINDDGGPVSQMQKIALQRIGDDGQRYYLSASGTITGSGFGGNAGSNGLGLTDVRNADRQTGPQSLHYQAPRTREERSVHGVTVVDEVDDWLCWTIVGICESNMQITVRFAHLPCSQVPVYVLRRARQLWYDTFPADYPLPDHLHAAHVPTFDPHARTRCLQFLPRRPRDRPIRVFGDLAGQYWSFTTAHIPFEPCVWERADGCSA